MSIVTPSYQRASFLPTCLASVRAQTYPDIEHIVVDGGSTDGTVDLLRAAEAECGLRWVSEPDRGMYDAINKGLAMARGDVIAYVNTDDAYLPWSVEVAVEALRPGPDVVFGDLLLVTETPRLVRSHVQFYEDFDPFVYTFVRTIGQPTVFWTRRALDAVGPFSDEYRLLADCDYWLRLAEAGFVPEHVSEVLAAQVDHGETLRETQAQTLREEFVRLRAAHAHSAGRRRVPPAVRRLQSSLAWRRDIWGMWSSVRTGRAARWPRFVAAMRDEGLSIRMPYLLGSMLPRVLRREAPGGLLDGPALMAALIQPGGPGREKA